MGDWFRENILDTGRLPLFCFFAAFVLTFVFIRFSVRMIRAEVSWWPGNITPGGLHIHHIVHWAQRGLTIPPNLVCLCPTHHRQLHDGELTIEGNPENGTLRFYDARGRPIEPPDLGPPRQLRLDEPSPFNPPFGERLDPRWFGWN